VFKAHLKGRGSEESSGKKMESIEEGKKKTKELGVGVKLTVAQQRAVSNREATKGGRLFKDRKGENVPLAQLIGKRRLEELKKATGRLTRYRRAKEKKGTTTLKLLAAGKVEAIEGRSSGNCATRARQGEDAGGGGGERGCRRDCRLATYRRIRAP